MKNSEARDGMRVAEVFRGTLRPRGEGTIVDATHRRAGRVMVNFDGGNDGHPGAWVADLELIRR